MDEIRVYCFGTLSAVIRNVRLLNAANQYEKIEHIQRVKYCTMLSEVKQKGLFLNYNYGMFFAVAFTKNIADKSHAFIQLLVVMHL